ncbi:MAG: ParA family protein [Clostridia bacterium]
MAKIITFSNQKGGVGKTTTCINLAAYVAEKGYRVLVVDMDPQGNASSALGVFDRTSKHTIYEVLCDDLDIKSALSSTDISSLKLLPSSSDLAGAEIELAQVVIGRERVLEEKLDGVKADFDYIFIDCPPSLGLLTVNALTATNSVIIPIQCEFFALEGLSQMMNTVKLVKKFLNPLISVDGVVLTMYDSRSKLSKEVNEEIVKFFGDTVFDTKIPRNVRLAEAPSYGKPVVVYDKRCSGAIAYSALADEFLTKIKP